MYIRIKVNTYKECIYKGGGEGYSQIINKNIMIHIERQKIRQ